MRMRWIKWKSQRRWTSWKPLSTTSRRNSRRDFKALQSGKGGRKEQREATELRASENESLLKTRMTIGKTWMPSLWRAKSQRHKEHKSIAGINGVGGP